MGVRDLLSAFGGALAAHVNTFFSVSSGALAFVLSVLCLRLCSCCELLAVGSQLSFCSSPCPLCSGLCALGVVSSSLLLLLAVGSQLSFCFSLCPLCSGLCSL